MAFNSESDNFDTGRVRIKDIAEELGVSTATVSNVIHGKTKKISPRTVEKVQEMLESSGYIPNIAAVLLAQNSSKIVCVVLSDDIKYEKQMINDPFISQIINGLSGYLNENGYFMMLKIEQDINKIVQYASMWNMAGLILIGYCNMDYNSLRNKMHIPFVVIDGYFEKVEKYSNVGIDNFNGGYQVGQYLASMGHENIMYMADNDDGGDHERYEGFKKALSQKGIIHKKEDFKLIPIPKGERHIYFKTLLKETGSYTAVFCASDIYAIDIMNYFIDHGIRIPEEISVVGFDDIPASTFVRPQLTTVKQDTSQRAKVAVEQLDSLIKNPENTKNIILPVSLIIRDSVKNLNSSI